MPALFYFTSQGRACHKASSPPLCSPPGAPDAGAPFGLWGVEPGWSRRKMGRKCTSGNPGGCGIGFREGAPLTRLGPFFRPQWLPTRAQARPLGWPDGSRSAYNGLQICPRLPPKRFCGVVGHPLVGAPDWMLLGAGQGGSGPHTADACTGPSLPNYRRPERSIHHKYPEGLSVCEVCVCVCVGWCYYRG